MLHVHTHTQHTCTHNTHAHTTHTHTHTHTQHTCTHNTHAHTTHTRIHTDTPTPTPPHPPTHLQIPCYMNVLPQEGLSHIDVTTHETTAMVSALCGYMCVTRLFTLNPTHHTLSPLPHPFTSLHLPLPPTPQPSPPSHLLLPHLNAMQEVVMLVKHNCFFLPILCLL